MIFVTCEAGFIGSNFVLNWLAGLDDPVLNFEKMTHAGNLNNLVSPYGYARHMFLRDDICKGEQVLALRPEWQPRAFVHFAAEFYVDRSLYCPAEIINTNLNGTFWLLEAVRAY
jgi:dTDP-glucose 4,6-dehydratase